MYRVSNPLSRSAVTGKYRTKKNRFITESEKQIVAELPEGYTWVLDRGYVGLLGVHGDDRGKVSPPNAARTSFKKDSSGFSDEQNDRLTHYLLKKKEFACLRHNVLTFEIRMPLMVARQYWKYVVASNWTEDQLGWNENSKRYITEENEFYIPSPSQWRTAPENKKQGSGEPLKPGIGQNWTDLLVEWTQEGEKLYQKALEANIAPELARLFTANGNYVTCQWTTSLNALLHFLDERLDSHAQYEIRQYAHAVEKYFAEAFPVVHQAWKSAKEEEAQEAASRISLQQERDDLYVRVQELEAQLAQKPWYKKVFK